MKNTIKETTRLMLNKTLPKKDGDEILVSLNSSILDELEKLISKYDEDHSHVGVVTCDTNDVWIWIDEVKEKLNIQ